MKNMIMRKNRTLLIAVFAVILIIAFSFENAQAEEWSGWRYSDGAAAIIDTATVYPGCESSIQITNNDYTCQSVTRTFNVKPNTAYKASVMAKNENYIASPNAAGEGGAKLGIPDGYLPGTPCYSGNDWIEIAFEFTTEANQTAYTIAMWNGIWGGECKGSAYFCNFKLEESGSDGGTGKDSNTDRPYPDCGGSLCEGWVDHVTGKVAPIDTNITYPGCDESVKVVNSQYTTSYVTKDFKVEPNSHYRASIMAKNENHQPLSTAAGESGAKFGVPGEYLPGTPCYSGSDWKKLTFEFDTKEDQTTYTLALWNGVMGADCMGTAYFSDFRLEKSEVEKTNEWNALVVVFKNIAAPVETGGRKYTYKDSLNDNDVKYMGKIIRQMYTSIPRLSDERWKISAVDVYGVDTPITNLETYGKKSYCIDYYDSTVRKELDALMESAYQNSGRTYDQIIIISPILGELSEEWLGLGGSDYYGTRICQLNYMSGSESYSNNKYAKGYEETAVVHEMLHGIETLTRAADPGNFVKFHANIDEYKGIYTDQKVQKGLTGWGAYHSDYMRCATPDGKGVNKKVFYHGSPFNWKVIYGKAPVKPKKTDIQSLNVKEVTAKTYTGKAIRPNVTIYDGKYRLVKNTDYTLSYQNNTKTGKAAVIITGKGKYTGTYCKTFNITPKQAVVTASKSSKGYKISWKSIAGADKIQIYVAKKGSSTYKLKKTVSGASVSTVISVSKGDKVKIRSYKSIYPQKYYSTFSKVVVL